MKQESIQLYPYLVAHLKGEDSKDILKDMRTNSAIIERSVEGFLSHYGGYPVSEVNAERFDIEIEGVVGEFCEGINAKRLLSIRSTCLLSRTNRSSQTARVLSVPRATAYSTPISQ